MHLILICVLQILMIFLLQWHLCCTRIQRLFLSHHTSLVGIVLQFTINRRLAFTVRAYMINKTQGTINAYGTSPKLLWRTVKVLSIELLMAKWELKCTKLLDAHKILPETKSSLISNSIEIVEIQAALCHSWVESNIQDLAL